MVELVRSGLATATGERVMAWPPQGDGSRDAADHGRGAAGAYGAAAMTLLIPQAPPIRGASHL